MLRDAFTADSRLVALISEAADNGVARVGLRVGPFFLLLICRKPQKQKQQSRPLAPLQGQHGHVRPPANVNMNCLHALKVKMFIPTF